MDLKVRLGVRFEEKDSLREFLDDLEVNSTFNSVCYKIMDRYFLEKGTTCEKFREMLIRRIFNDVYSCATNTKPWWKMWSIMSAKSYGKETATGAITTWHGSSMPCLATMP